MRWLFSIGLILVLVGCASTASEDTPAWQPPERPPTVEPSNVELATGQRNYEAHCAHCHGYAGDGQSTSGGPGSVQWSQELGYDLVPRHDAEGTTWQHPDQLLFEVIKDGVDNPLNLYVMGSYDTILEDDEIWGVIEYMKIFWTDEQRAHQEAVTERFNENQPRSTSNNDSTN